MFALHTPQTITLAVPGDDGPFTTINFRTNGADSSRCVMEIISADGDLHRLTFTTRGALVDQQYISADHHEQDVHLTAEDYLVNGRDTRADNPYTHVAPVDADTAYRDGQTPGYRQPAPQTNAEKEAVESAGAENLYAEAREHKKDLRDAALERRKASQEQAGIHVADGDLKTEDDTTAKDVSWDAPHDSTIPHAEYVPPQPGDPNYQLAPAPSTASPGGEPVHPLEEQGIAERSNVNTTRTLNNPQ